MRLSVNIDHFATLRQARGEADPDPLAAARVARSAGADLIVAHLRQDRRHIQERDLVGLRKLFKRGLHLELSSVPEMIQIGTFSPLSSGLAAFLLIAPALRRAG